MDDMGFMLIGWALIFPGGLGVLLISLMIYRAYERKHGAPIEVARRDARREALEDALRKLELMSSHSARSDAISAVRSLLQ